MQPAGKIADYLFYHECAHARFPLAMNQAQTELIAIGAFQAQAGVFVNYFGTGQAYWAATLACASQPPRLAEMIYGQSQPGTSTGALCCMLDGVRVGPFPPPHYPFAVPAWRPGT